MELRNLTPITFPGQCGVTLNSDYFVSEDETDPDHVKAADNKQLFALGWYTYPIFQTGDYPDIMKTKIKEKSDAQVRKRTSTPYMKSLYERFEVLKKRSIFQIFIARNKVPRAVFLKAL